MDANLKFKAENVLLRCMYLYLGYYCYGVNTDWLLFSSYLVPLVHRTDVNLKFLLIDSEVRSWLVSDAGRPESNAAGGAERARVSPGFWIVSYMSFKENSLWENSESVSITLSNIQSAITL